jgi:hypothetical protein
MESPAKWRQVYHRWNSIGNFCDEIVLKSANVPILKPKLASSKIREGREKSRSYKVQLSEINLNYFQKSGI